MHVLTALWLLAFWMLCAGVGYWFHDGRRLKHRRVLARLDVRSGLAVAPAGDVLLSHAPIVLAAFDKQG